MKILLILMLSLSVQSYFAQHDHSSHGGSHEEHAKNAPHGGELKMVGKYHIEVVENLMNKKDKLKVFVLKRNLKPVPVEEISGHYIITYKNGKTESSDFKSTSLGYFPIQVTQLDEFQCKFLFTINSKKVTTIFFGGRM